MSLPKGTTGRSGYNPSQPRVPKGNGDESGEWSGAANSSSGIAAKAPETHQQRVARFKQLSQKGVGYYNWGTPTHGAAQQALPETIEVIEAVAKEWRDAGKPPFGVGNIGLKTGRVEKIFFNDPKIKGVEPLAGHNNHLHVKMKLP